MIFFLESSKTAFSNVDPPPLRSETEAHVERHGFGSQFQHRGQRARVLRGFDAIMGQVLRGQLKWTGARYGRHLSVSGHADRPRIAKLWVGRRKIREALHAVPI